MNGNRQHAAPPVKHAFNTSTGEIVYLGSESLSKSAALNLGNEKLQKIILTAIANGKYRSYQAPIDKDNLVCLDCKTPHVHPVEHHPTSGKTQWVTIHFAKVRGEEHTPNCTFAKQKNETPKPKKPIGYSYLYPHTGPEQLALIPHHIFPENLPAGIFRVAFEDNGHGGTKLVSNNLGDKRAGSPIKSMADALDTYKKHGPNHFIVIRPEGDKFARAVAVQMSKMILFQLAKEEYIEHFKNIARGIKFPAFLNFTVNAENSKISNKAGKKSLEIKLASFDTKDVFNNRIAHFYTKIVITNPEIYQKIKSGESYFAMAHPSHKINEASGSATLIFTITSADDLLQSTPKKNIPSNQHHTHPA